MYYYHDYGFLHIQLLKLVTFCVTSLLPEMYSQYFKIALINFLYYTARICTIILLLGGLSECYGLYSSCPFCEFPVAVEGEMKEFQCPNQSCRKVGLSGN